MTILTCLHAEPIDGLIFVLAVCKTRFKGPMVGYFMDAYI